MARAAVGCCVLVALLGVADASFGGVLQTSYKEGLPLGIRVNSLTSVQNIMPYEWYSLPFCAPSKDERQKYNSQKQNLGEVLFGDKVEISLYSVKVLQNMACVQVCPPREYTPSEVLQFRNRIEQRYRGNMLFDGLPVAEESTTNTDRQVAQGFPLGVPRSEMPNEQTLLNNHLAFTVTYVREQGGQDLLAAAGGEEDADETKYRIVGFSVKAHSIDHSDPTSACTESFKPEGAKTLTLGDARDANNKVTVEWTYSVVWKEDDKGTTWSTRWDVYMKSTPVESRIHWFAIINSLLVVVFLSVIVAVILLRALYRDFTRYNDPESLEEQQEETGWKLVHGQVFRKPAYPVLLSAYVGTGAQLLGMACSTLVFALFGFLSPANRGALMSALIFLFVLLGSLAGYTSARMLKMFDLREWKHIFIVGTMYPGQNILIWFALNLILWSQDSASAVPFRTILTIFALWLGVSLVLVLLGAVVGFKRDKIEPVCKPSRIDAPPIPPQPWYLRSPQAMLLPGVLPFGAAFIESVFILSSVWQGRVYYVFGFLALVFLILIVTCAETTIVLIYFQLTREDYHWWWRSFLTSGSYGVWLYLYCIVYYYTSLNITSFASSVLYFGYMFMVSYFFFVLTGFIGFISAAIFVRIIYSYIRVD